MSGNHVAVVMAVVVLSACAAKVQPAAQDDAAAKQAIEAASHQELARFTSGNVDSVGLSFTSDVVVMPPNEPAVNGREALKTWAKGMSEQFAVSGTYPTSDVQVMGDWAVQRYTVDLSMTPKAGGAAMPFKGKGIHVFHKQADGTWLIAQDVWNDDAPPAAMPASPAPAKK